MLRLRDKSGAEETRTVSVKGETATTERFKLQ